MNVYQLTDEFIPPQLAMEFAKLGFDYPCFTAWRNGWLSGIGGSNLGIKNSLISKNHKEFLNKCAAPTYWQILIWLETENGITIEYESNRRFNEINYFCFKIYGLTGDNTKYDYMEHLGEDVVYTLKELYDKTFEKIIELLKIKHDEENRELS